MAGLSFRVVISAVVRCLPTQPTSNCLSRMTGRRFVADVSHGGVNVGFEQSFVANNSDLLKIGIGLDNSNNHNCGGTAVFPTVFGRLMRGPFGIGPIWPADPFFTTGIQSCFAPNWCDGIAVHASLKAVVASRECPA